MTLLSRPFGSWLSVSLAGAALALLLTGAPSARADDMPTLKLLIKGGRFLPATLDVPANTKFRLEITNEGPGPEEFESAELKKEKVVAAGVTTNLIFQPLKPGSYRFFGEFHPDTAQGQMVAK